VDRWHYGVGLAAVVLAAVAGFGGLADLLGKHATAVVALAAAATTAVATFLQADSKRQVHEQRATAWDSFRDNLTVIVHLQPGLRDGPEAQQPRWQQVMDAFQTRARDLRDGQA
jgi:hypothetical protein